MNWSSSSFSEWNFSNRLAKCSKTWLIKSSCSFAMSTTSTKSYFSRILSWRRKYNLDHLISKWRFSVVLISIHNHECFSISLSTFLSTTRHSTRLRRWNLKWNSFLYIKLLFKCFLLMSIDLVEFLKAKIIYHFFLDDSNSF